MSDLIVNGNSVNIPSGRASYAAIDTGTTLVGGPLSAVGALFNQIPGAQAGTGNFDGYYIYRESLIAMLLDEKGSFCSVLRL